MIQVKLVFQSEDGDLLSAFDAKGHAIISKGESSIACASFSLLVRSFCGVMETEAGKCCNMAAPKPGDLSFYLVNIDQLDLNWYRGLCDVLLRGIKDLKDLYPEDIEWKIERR